MQGLLIIVSYVYVFNVPNKNLKFIIVQWIIQKLRNIIHTTRLFQNWFAPPQNYFKINIILKKKNDTV